MYDHASDDRSPAGLGTGQAEHKDTIFPSATPREQLASDPLTPPERPELPEVPELPDLADVPDVSETAIAWRNLAYDLGDPLPPPPIRRTGHEWSCSWCGHLNRGTYSSLLCEFCGAER